MSAVVKKRSKLDLFTFNNWIVAVTNLPKRAADDICCNEQQNFISQLESTKTLPRLDGVFHREKKHIISVDSKSMLGLNETSTLWESIDNKKVGAVIQLVASADNKERHFYVTSEMCFVNAQNVSRSITFISTFPIPSETKIKMLSAIDCDCGLYITAPSLHGTKLHNISFSS